MEVNHAQLKELVKKFRKAKIPLFVKGATGVGKSEAIMAEAREYSEKVAHREFKQWNELVNDERHNLLDSEQIRKIHLFIDVRTALLEPPDLMGMPDFNRDNGYVVWKPTLMFKILSSPDISATIFFDEFNLGSRMVQNASYQIILDKAIGELKLGKDVFILAAGNRAEDKASVIETPMPLNNRFGHCTLLVPTDDEWIRYNMSSDSPEPRIAGFLKCKPEYVHNFKANQKEEAFTSPRALQKLAVMMVDIDDGSEKGLNEITTLAKSMCGDAFGTQLQAFIKLNRKVNVDDILAKPEKIKEYVHQLDLKYSIISSMAFKCKQDSKKYLEPCLQVCAYMDDESGVFSVRMIKEIVGATKLVKHLKESKTWDKVLSKKFEGLLGWNEDEDKKN